MAGSSRFAALAALRKSRDFTKLLAMMALSFLVIFVVGVLRPIRDAIALDGLEPGEFYQVYFVSAIVVLFVPIYNRLANRIRWKELIPGVALFFAASMVVFRFLYRPGNAAFGMAFYGWYDLMVAALVTQFFMATQLFYNARDAKRAYPVVIAAGSIGAAVGGGITAFFAERVGTANLLLVATAAIVAFAIGISLVWRREDPDAGRPRTRGDDEERAGGELRRIVSNPQVRLIAVTVLLTVLVKQFVDYEYKTLTREVFQDLDRMSGFLGTVDAATQWLPILVLAALRPILRRWGAGIGVMIFPVAMVFATGALATILTLPVAVFARTSEKMFRYSAERTGREILYVPVPDEIRLKAKAYIDVAIEKGFGKALSGLLILGLVAVTGSLTVTSRLVTIGFLSVGTALLLLVAFLRVRRQYVRTLAASFEGRFASLRGTFVSLLGPGPRKMVGEALRDPSPLKMAFALELIEQGDEEDAATFSGELEALLEHESADLRGRALDVLARSPATLPEAAVRARLHDADPVVREKAARALARAAGPEAAERLADLLGDPDPGVRSAALACMASELEADAAARAAGPFFEARVGERSSEDAGQRLEVATAAGLVPDREDAREVVRELMGDRDDAVVAAATRSAARIGTPELIEAVIAALGSPRTRGAARAALSGAGEAALEPLRRALDDRRTPPSVRRNVPGALGDIATPATVDALIHSYMLPETEQVLDNRALAALAKLRGGAVELSFPEDRVREAVLREVEAAGRYARGLAAASTLDRTPASELLERGLREARTERREAVFRWLGLIYPQTSMYRSHLAIEEGDDRTRANALEWLESQVGHAFFLEVQPVLDGEGPPPDAATAGDALRDLWDDEDVWLARCALRACAESDPEGTRARLETFEPGDPGLRRVVETMRATGGSTTTSDELGDEMDLIEKVFLLQNVDLLSGTRSGQLALLASIAREVDAEAGRVLLTRGEPPPALYVVIRGDIALEGLGSEPVRVSEGAAFGTWALIDPEPSLVEARAVSDCRLLRILRGDFHDLLVDHPELGLDLLQGLARRIRALAPA